jgi:uncharacterized membrane protein
MCFNTTYIGRTIFLLGLVLSFLFTNVALAQEVHEEWQETVKARVLEVLEENDRDIMGTGATTTVQKLRVELLEGERKGEVVVFENDLIVLEPGDKIFVNRLEAIDGTEYYIFKDVHRLGGLIALAVLLFLVTIIFAGYLGLRALLSLSFSIGAIIFGLVPALLHGYSAITASLVISIFILAVTLFFTHGFKPHIITAFLGTITAVAVTCLLAVIFNSWLRLTGFGSDASVYLNFATGGRLDMSELLLGAIIIGLLGVLDDVAVTQASVVQELKAANNSFGFKDLYVRAVRVGKDHIGSLINTLALAYVGAALPLILLLVETSNSLTMTLNQEVLASELLRLGIGSIGLILAVPLTTAFAAWYFKDRVVKLDHDHLAHHHH